MNKVKKEIQKKGEYIQLDRKAPEQEKRKKGRNKEQEKKQRNKDETKFEKRRKERLQLIKNRKINSENLNKDGQKVRMKEK